MSDLIHTAIMYDGNLHIGDQVHLVRSRQESDLDAAERRMAAWREEFGGNYKYAILSEPRPTPVKPGPEGFTLFWLSGKTQYVKGSTIEVAFQAAGYGAGALRGLDFYEVGDTADDWVYASDTHEWTRKEPE